MDDPQKDYITIHKAETYSTGVSHQSKRVEVVDGKAVWAHDFKIPLDMIGHVAGGPFYGFAFTKEHATMLELQKIETMLGKAKAELKRAQVLYEKLLESENK